jgi:hypothetical protein
MQNLLKNEIRTIISGKSEVRYGTAIQAATRHLGNGSPTSPKSEVSKHLREQETKELEGFISEKNLWIVDIDFSKYVSEGSEQRVFLKGSDSVIKLNDAIYYGTWKDYFYNLLIHNFFFPDTAYELLGFSKENDSLFAVVQQDFVSITETTDLNRIKAFLSSNGFLNTRNNDYFNPDLGIILEYLHDENVLTRNGVLYFIDTVFYLTNSFWE